MTNAHFEAIARVVRMVAEDARAGEFDHDPLRPVELIATNLATDLALFNHNFDRARFLRACGVA